MKASFVRSYRSKKGNTVFVYTVKGTAAQIESYKAAQGDKLVMDDNGTPLWFTTRFATKNVDLIITSSGNVIADMSAFEQAASLSSQFGGNFGNELARIAAAQLLGTAPAPVAEAAPAPVAASVGDPDLDE